jgi:MFS family permease
VLYYLTVGALTICYMMVYEFFSSKKYASNELSEYWQSKIYVSETFFPLIFGYFLDKFGRKNCLLMLTLTAIVPGLMITLSAFFTQVPDFVRIGMLLLGASFQSCHVAMITGLFAWTGNIFMYMMAITGVHMLNLLSYAHNQQTNGDLDDQIFLGCLVPLLLILIFVLWRLEKSWRAPTVIYQSKNYLLNVYFIFALVQSLNYCVTDLILGSLLNNKLSDSSLDSKKQVVPLVGTLVCYGCAFFVLLFIFLQKRVTLMMLTFVADILMSFGILFLMVLFGTDFFNHSQVDNKFMKDGVRLFSLALTSTAGYIFLISSLMIVMRSTHRKGIAVGAIISIYRFTRIVLNDLDLMTLVWLGLAALLIQKLSYFLIGFYDAHRFRLMFRPYEDYLGKEPPGSANFDSLFRKDSSLINNSLA